MDQRARMAALDAFRKGQITLLVASDVAARGLDIPDVSHVFNYDVPIHADDYVHRIGRTGRAGRSGVALSIVTKGDVKHLEAIEALTKVKIDWRGPSLEDYLATRPAVIDDEGEHRPRGRREDRGGDKRRGGSRTSDADPRRRKPREESRTPANDDEADVARPPKPVRAETRPERATERPVERAAEQPRAATARREERPQRRHREEDGGPSVLGFGDQLPGFMTRSTGVKKVG